MVRVVLALFVVYVAACASGLVPMAAAGGPTLALILVPLWLVDGVKGLVESLHPATYRTGAEDLGKVTTVIASRNGATARGSSKTPWRTCSGAPWPT